MARKLKTDEFIERARKVHGDRDRKVQYELQKAGATNVQIDVYPFSNDGEAIVVEHLAQQQVVDHQFVVPVERKFPGHTEVFTERPNLSSIESHPILQRYRTGDRWNPRQTAESVERDS